MERVVIISACRDAYSGSEASKGSMTVSQLIDKLRSDYRPDMKVILSHDNGYTFGSITGGRMYDSYIEEEEDDFEEEEEE